MKDNRMKILIAYDGSKCADEAIEDLIRTGLPADARAIAVTIEEQWLPAPPMSSYEFVRMVMPSGDVGAKLAPVDNPGLSPAQNLALKAKAKIQKLFPAWEVYDRAVIGSPATEILKIADEWRANLIVVGSHGRTALGRFFFGSVSHKIATEAHCSVRINRCDPMTTGEQQKILIGLDGSSGSEAAVREVASRKWAADTEVRLVMVCDPLKPSLMGNLIPQVTEFVEESNKEEHDWAKEIVEKQAAVLHDAGLKVSWTIMEGDPRRALLNEAEDWQATTIFLGARGLSKIDRFLLGSVSAAIASRAECSVEVVRPEE